MNIARIAPAALTVAALVGAASAPAALNAYRTNVRLAHDQKTTDGKLLKAGPYDLEINFAGKGNTAEFVFHQGGAVVGRQTAEARGFQASGPEGGARSPETKWQSDGKPIVATEDAKNFPPGDPRTVKLNPSQQKVNKLQDEKGGVVQGNPAEFTWAAAGFGPKVAPKTTQGPAGRLIIAVDSANSAAGFRTELLPAVQVK